MQIGSDVRKLPTLPKGEPQAPDDKQGALVIIDSFQNSQSHGFSVEGAAATLGSTGPVFRYHQHQQVGGRSTMPHVLAIARFQAAMANGPLDAAQASDNLQQFVEGAAAGNLELATSILGQVTAEGFHQSVVNYSQGLDSIVLLQLLQHPLGETSKLDDAHKATYRDNLRQAVGPQGASANDQQLDNLLLQTIKHTLSDSPTVQEATTHWREQVTQFESGHNSVIIAAGNSGIPVKGMQRAKFDIDGSEDRNIFAVPEVTVVGATATTPSGGITLHASSSFGPEVGFLAPGDFGESFGTSYASPKVANAFRAAHLTNPEMTSQQVEEWAKSELSQLAQVGGQQVALLDTERAHSLLRITSA